MSARIPQNQAKIEVMAQSLLEWETQDSSEVDEIMSGKNPTPPEIRPEKPSSSSDSTPDSDTMLDESDLDLPNPDGLN